MPGSTHLLLAVGGVREGLAEALDLASRIGTAVGRMEELLGRMDHLLDRVAGLLHRVEGIADRADEAITHLHVTRRRADDAVQRMHGTTSGADEVVHRTKELVDRVDPLLADYEPALTVLAPLVRRLAASSGPSEVDALMTLLDRLPQLVASLDEEILPVLETLGTVGPDIHDLLDTVQDMRQVVKGVPGSRLFHRRGAEETAGDGAREVRADTGS